MTKEEAIAAGYVRCYTHKTYEPRAAFGRLQSHSGGICKEANAQNNAIHRHKAGRYAGTYPVGVGHRKYAVPEGLAGVANSRTAENELAVLEARAAASSVKRHLQYTSAGTYPVGVGARKYPIPEELAGVPNTRHHAIVSRGGSGKAIGETWPFVRDESELLKAIDSAVPKNMPREMRAEVCQELAVLVLSGDVAIHDLASMLPEVKTNFNQMFNRRFTDVQLSTPIYHNSERTTLAETLVADATRDYATPLPPSKKGTRPVMTPTQIGYASAKAAHETAKETPRSYLETQTALQPLERALFKAETALYADTAQRIGDDPKLIERYSELAARAAKPTPRPMESAQLVTDCMNAELGGTASMVPLKPLSSMSNCEIRQEVSELHEQFQKLAQAYDSAFPVSRSQVRDAMRPVVERENALRAEFMGRTPRATSIDLESGPEMALVR